MVNESQATGEAKDRRKDFHSPLLSGGTEVREGACAMVVVAVGVHSAWGKIMQKLHNKQKKATPLQEKLADVASLVSSTREQREGGKREEAEEWE